MRLFSGTWRWLQGAVGLLWLLCLSGCAGLQQVPTPVADDSAATAPGVATQWRYGNFCGKDHPPVDTRLPLPQQINQLLAIAPIDDVDMACQFHDICYTVAGSPHSLCDKVLRWNLKTVDPSIPKVQRDVMGFFREQSSLLLDGCARLLSEMGLFSDVASAWNAEQLSDRLIGSMGGMVSVVVNAPVMLVGGALEQAQAIGLGAKRDSCTAHTEPLYLFPADLQELERLRQCYRPDTEFAQCVNPPTRGRASSWP